jgi:hypothetical protein
MPVPTLTAEQRRQAYEKALALRRTRSALKTFLSNHLHPVEALRVVWDEQYEAQGMKVYDLLKALPGIAERRARSILEDVGIDDRKTVRSCGPRQRQRLFELVEEQAKGPR